MINWIFNLRRSTYSAFRNATKLLSGLGLRYKYPFLNKIYLGLNSKRAPGHTEILGLSFFLDSNDSMNLVADGMYEPGVTYLIRSVLTPGDKAIDIGANIGYYTCIMGTLVGSDGRVYAFEPDPESFRLLQVNVHSNRLSNVELIKKAVSDKNGTALLFRDKFGNLDHRMFRDDTNRVSVDVDSIRLDDYFETLEINIDLIKMDIQGAEGLALTGMQALLMRNRPLGLITEFWPDGLDASGYGSSKYLKQLAKIGFDFNMIEEDGSYSPNYYTGDLPIHTCFET
jgi:FkbM family methyltransferase